MHAVANINKRHFLPAVAIQFSNMSIATVQVIEADQRDTCFI